jgi:ABC-2 type transport system ATP-binding protein
MAEQKPIISIDHVSMRFNLSKEKHESLKEYFVALLHGGVRFDEFFALDDVSFDIMPGDFYGLIGLNGSGKSTLLKVISGVYKPSAGKVTVNGTIAPLIELGAGFDMDLTARENIYLNGTVLGYTPKYIDSKFDDIVEFSELQEFLDVPLKNYSSGMVARLAFAVATITKPDILIADEILSVGDFLFQEKCEKRMAELLSGGTTVILVSHSMEDIARYANRVLVMSKAKVAMYDTVEKVFARAPELLELGLSVPQVTQVFLMLKAMGMEIDTDVYTVPYAVKTVLKAWNAKHPDKAVPLPQNHKTVQEGGAD